MDRYKNMGFGEFIDGEFVEYEDMTEEQLEELFADDYRQNWLHEREELEKDLLDEEREYYYY